jgi:hypothetical protein
MQSHGSVIGFPDITAPIFQLLNQQISDIFFVFHDQHVDHTLASLA